MKNILVLIFASISMATFAQTPVEKTVGEFSELKVYDLIHVELIKSNEDKVVISGKNKDDVLVNNKNGTLKIKMKLEEAFDGNSTTVKLYYTKVDIIDVNEGAQVNVSGTIEQFEIDLNAQEGGSINVNLNVTYANVRAVTGGDIFASGSSKKQTISIYTGGDYDGEDLKTEVTEVSIRAAGTAKVNASKKVVAKVRAGGTISIYGDPKDVEESKVLGGRINRID